MTQETLPFQAHSDTSRAAAESLPTSSTATQRMRVLDCIREAGSRGRTDCEIQDLLGMQGNTQRPRRLELLDRGLIRNSGETRKTSSGRKAAVWVVA